jgi:hypothetical protein
MLTYHYEYWFIRRAYDVLYILPQNQSVILVPCLSLYVLILRNPFSKSFANEIRVSEF